MHNKTNLAEKKIFLLYILPFSKYNLDIPYTSTIPPNFLNPTSSRGDYPKTDIAHD